MATEIISTEQTTGGLSGKARRNRAMRRAAKFHTDQLIGEYFDFESRQRRSAAGRMGIGRPIPIRGRSEFLPSAISLDESDFAAMDEAMENASAVTESQHPTGGSPARSWERRIVWPPEAVREERAREAKQSPPVTDRVIQFPAKVSGDKQPRTTLRFPQEWPAPRQLRARRGRRYTFGGFAYGCLLGSAAAAMILVVVDIALR